MNDLDHRHPQERGEVSRARILAAIHEWHAAHRGWPIVEEIARLTGLGRSTVRHHVAWLASSVPPRVHVRATRAEVVLLEVYDVDGLPPRSGSAECVREGGRS